MAMTVALTDSGRGNINRSGRGSSGGNGRGNGKIWQWLAIAMAMVMAVALAMAVAKLPNEPTVPTSAHARTYVYLPGDHPLPPPLAHRPPLSHQRV